MVSGKAIPSECTFFYPSSWSSQHNSPDQTSCRCHRWRSLQSAPRSLHQWIFFSFFANNFRSSMKSRWLILHPSFVFSYSFLRIIDKGNSTKTNSIGDRESPWKIPRLMFTLPRHSSLPSNLFSVFLCSHPEDISRVRISCPIPCQQFHNPLVWYVCLLVVYPCHGQISFPVPTVLKHRLINNYEFVFRSSGPLLATFLLILDITTNLLCDYTDLLQWYRSEVYTSCVNMQ